METRMVAVEHGLREVKITIDQMFNRQLDQGKELVRVDAEIKGVRSQAERHNEKSVAALYDMNSKLDKILWSFGMNDDKFSQADLQKDLYYVRAARESGQQNTSWIKQYFIAAVIPVIAISLWEGFRYFVKGNG